MTEAQWGIILACLTGATLKGLDWWLNRSGRSLSQRKDLREEVAELWKRIDQLEREVDEWRQRTYRLEEQISAKDRELEDLRHRLAPPAPQPGALGA